MPLSIDSALGIHATALELRARRAELLASNLANMDTPNYKARDFNFRAAMTQALQGQEVLATTDPKDIEPSGAPGTPKLLYRIPSQPSLDGNTVDPNLERAAFAENAVQYRATLTFLTDRIRTLMTAIRGQ